jgi:methionine-gamma-lyase
MENLDVAGFLSDEEANTYTFATQTIHTNEMLDCSAAPIYMGVTSPGGRYGREGCPTLDILEDQIARLEGAEAGFTAACGMSAISQTMLTLLDSGDRIVFHAGTYSLVAGFFQKHLHRFGILAAPVDFKDLQALEDALKTPAKVVYFEPLSNPGMDVLDVRAVAEIAHRASALVIVDNTFLSPYLFKPLSLGVDIVIHSATKYLNGHGDAMGGLVASNQKIISRLQSTRSSFGGVLSPFNAFLILRGIQTLAIRMDQHCFNAQKIAEFLLKNDQVQQVRYPGLPSDPGYKLAKQQFQNFGGVLGFQVKGGSGAAQAFKQGLKLCKTWWSLGDTMTLVTLRDSGTEYKIPPGYLRLSVGQEGVTDIIRDIDNALWSSSHII